MSKSVLVKFHPDDIQVEVKKGTSVLEAAISVGVYIDSICGGRGKCGKCKVILKRGEPEKETEKHLAKDEVEKGYVLACKTHVQDDTEILVPEESRLGLHQILKRSEVVSLGELNPLVRKQYLEIEPPTLEDNVSDLSRLERALEEREICDTCVSLPMLKKISKVLRKKDWKVTLTFADAGRKSTVVDIESGDTTHKLYGVAVDIGTTTVVVELVDLTSGQVIDCEADYNKQVMFGEDVLTRILYATEEEKGLSKLKKAIVSTINYLIGALAKRNGLRRRDIQFMTAAGNTTMTHLFLGLDPAQIRIDPYIPVANNLPFVRAGETGIKINRSGYVYCLPGRSSYVGGDITADILATNLHKKDELSMLIDVGTNGEVVLGNKDWMVSCSCSAGPAFEGGEVEFGIRATVGAIERVTLTPDLEVKHSTIGNVKPKGICGSGLIDLLAELFMHGAMNKAGQLEETGSERIREGDEGKEFVVIWSDEMNIKKDMVLSEVDIKNIMRTKAAVYAACSVLLKSMNYKFTDIKKLYVAGGFGNYLDVRKSVYLGLLPDVDTDLYTFIGNGAVAGSRLVLLDRGKLEEAKEIVRKMTYIELSVNTMFYNEFTSALFFPHTDINLFPSAKELLA
ncbi:MAG: ASKHA domain-containing protein [Thermoplasmata archaeon]